MTNTRHLALRGSSSLRSSLPLSAPALWNAFWKEPWSFKFTCIYVFLEYVRPQQVYSVLEILPWSRLTIAAAIGAYLLEGRGLQSRTIANTLLACLLVVVLLSSFFAYSPEYSFSRFVFFANWLVAFFLIANTAADQRKFFIFVVLFLLWSTKMSQFAARSFLLGGLLEERLDGFRIRESSPFRCASLCRYLCISCSACFHH